MTSGTDRRKTASLLLAGPVGGEVCKVLGIRVAYAPAVLERERVKVDRAPVNDIHDGELGLSAKRAGTAALQLLFREINHNEPVQRLWIDIEPPSLQVTGRSAELLFGLATYLHIGADGLPDGVPNSDYSATGSLDADGNIGSVEALAAKIRAALASSPQDGTKLFYPRADEGQIDDELRAESRSKGLILCPVDRIDEALDALGVPILGSWPSGLSPFRALEAFDSNFSRVFFGRQREVEALTSLLADRASAGRPGALVIGASGAGKSSFCLAGVIPALIRQKPGLQYAIWRPRDAVSGLGDEPAGELQLAQSILSQWQVRDDKQLGMALTHSPKGEPRLEDLPEFVAATSQCTVFVIDQFEELFTLNFTQQARIGFARLMQSLQARGIWVVGTLRSEFYANYLELCDEDGRVILTPLFQGDGQYNLPRMSRDAFSQVITRPAELAGLRFEQRADGVSLSQTLLTDAMATDDALPLLGFALQKLYDAMERPETRGQPDAAFPRTLGFAAYARLGGLAGAIGTVAAEAYAALDAQAQAELPRLLNTLAVPSADGNRETARPAPIDQWPLGSPGRRLLDELIRIRVLVSEEGATPEAPAQIRVAHEALFSHWSLATQLLIDSRQSRLLIEDFRQRAKVWDADGRPLELLLSSQRDVANARATLPLIPVNDANAPVAEFLANSVERARRKRHFLYASAAALALILSGTTGWALVSADQAERSAASERQARLKAEQSEADAETAQRKAEDATNAEQTARLQAQAAALAERQQRAEALQQRDVALAATRVATEQRRLAEAQILEARRQRSRAVAQLAEQAIDSGDAMTGILLARSQLQPGDEANWSGAAQAALLHGMLSNREVETIPNSGEAIVSPDGLYAITGSRDGTKALLWSLSGDRPTALELKGHIGNVVQAAFTADSKTVAVSNGPSIGLWGIDGTPRGSRISKPSQYHPKSMSFSPDGNRLIVGYVNDYAYIYSITAEDISSFKLPEKIGWAAIAKFSPDGRRVATSSDGDTRQNVLLWDVADEAVIYRRLSVPKRAVEVTSAVFSPDGEKIVTSYTDGSARIWPIRETDSLPIELLGHTNFAEAQSFSPDGRNVVTISGDQTARVWAVNGNDVRSVALTGHTDFISSAAFSPDGMQVVTTSGDWTVRVWTIVGDRAFMTALMKHQALVYSAVFLRDGSHILTNSQDGTLRIWAIRQGGQNYIELAKQEGALRSAIFSPDGQRVITAHGNGARVWTLSSGPLNSILLEGHSEAVVAAAFHPDGKRVLTASQDGTARLWTLEGASASSIELPGHSAALVGASFSPDGKQVVTASKDGTAQLWTIGETGVTPALLDGHGASLTSVEFSPDGRFVVTSSEDKTARIWWLDGGKVHWTVLRGHTQRVYSASFSPDGKSVVTASADRTARIWPLGGKVRDPVILKGHSEFVKSAAFSPDGKYVLTGSGDRTARIWKIDGDSPTSTVLAGHTDWVESARFSPDGRYVLTTSSDKTARFWTIDGGQASSVPFPLSGWPYVASFSPDGKQVISEVEWGIARIWKIPFGRDLVEQSTAVITRCLTADQRATAGIDQAARTQGPPCE